MKPGLLWMTDKGPQAMTPGLKSVDLVEAWVDRLGLMPDDELQLTLEINKALTQAHAEGYAKAQDEIAALRAENERLDKQQDEQWVNYQKAILEQGLEIERLRAALEKIADCDGLAEMCREIARAALSKLGENDDGRELQRKNLKHGWAK